MSKKISPNAQGAWNDVDPDDVKSLGKLLAKLVEVAGRIIGDLKK